MDQEVVPRPVAGPPRAGVRPRPAVEYREVHRLPRRLPTPVDGPGPDGAVDGDTLYAAFDRLGVAALWLTARGRLLGGTSRMQALLSFEPDADRLLAAAAALARSFVAHARPQSAAPADEAGRASRRLATGRARYSLRAVSLGKGGSGAGQQVVVAVEARRAAFLPGVRELMALHRLTRREAEVALLLAVGASDQEVAQRLTISPHTARKHAEHIFTKLGIHSRKALALELVESRRNAESRAQEPRG
ncbi:MAG: helix-turn-helix transcriptional regulator [Gemmatimonadetes bacterium]|nr:helix-turn-helix transcriptional regulator [Gemmatimonadota bacterium]